MSLMRSTLLVMTSRVLVLFSGLVVSVAAARGLSVVEQGYFFTFISLAAAQTLFELGVTGLILHHFSHARAALIEASDELLQQRAADELLTVRKFSSKYFLRAATFFVVVIGIGGAIFFSLNQEKEGVNWALAWTTMVAASGIGLFNLNFYCYVEGSGQINTSYQIRIRSTVVLIVSFVVLLTIFGGLMPYPLALLISNFYAYFSLQSVGNSIDRDFGIHGKTTSTELRIGKEQGRIALSAVAGYVTASSMTPYAFHFFGAKFAGQLGLTVSIFNAIATLAMARTTAEAPSYGTWIAKGELALLGSRFRSTQYFAAGLSIALCLLAIVCRELGLSIFPDLADRVLGTTGFIVASLLVLANVILSSTGTALRAFKAELLMLPSLAGAILVAISQLAFHLDPVLCLALLAAYNGLVFYPYARHLLFKKIAFQAS